MAARGRPKLARTNVEDRLWWEKIGRANEHDDPRRQSAPEDHWEWRGEPGAKLYPAWKPKGETPGRVLFYHLRPDDWDNRAPWSKLMVTCGEEGCINPWHAGFAKVVKSLPALEATRAADLSFAEDPDVMEVVWDAYLRWVEAEDRYSDWANLIWPYDGTVRESAYHLMRNDARAVVELERIVARDVMPTTDEAREKLAAIRAAKRERVKAFTAKLEEKKARARAGRPALYNVIAASEGRDPWEDYKPEPMVERYTSPADIAAEQHAMHLGLYTP